MSPRYLLAVVMVAAFACGGKPPEPQAPQGVPSGRWTAPSILAPVPADSPYVLALLEPVNDALRRRVMQNLDERFNAAMAKLDTVKTVDRGKLEPWLRALLAFTDELRGKPSATWLEQFGLNPRGRFVVYGLSMWPVARIEISDPAKLEVSIKRILAAAGSQPQQRTLGGRAYWVAGGTDFSLVAAVLEHEAVLALLPTATLDAALPLVLGTRAPEHSLAATSAVPDAMAQHHFLGFVVAYVDLHSVVNIVAGPNPGALDIPIRAATGPVAPECRADLDRLAAVMPRIAFGYRRFDDRGFEGSVVFELPPTTLAALRKLRTAVPEVTTRVPGHPLAMFGVAADPNEVVTWLRDVTRGIHDQPFRCAWFNSINTGAAELAGKVANPLPPTWRGLRGFSVTIDDASTSPPDVRGHVVIAGDRVADLVTSFAGAIPAIAGIPLARDGRPIALPVQKLQLPVPSAHLAITTDRLVIAAGEGSERRVTEHLTTPVPKSSPLTVMVFDIPRVQKLLASLGRPAVDNLGTLGTGGLALDVGDTGLDFDIWGTWAAAEPQIAAPPDKPAKP
jgi:hypothetical protein